MRGTTTITMSDLVRDTMYTHGMEWAVAYYYKRMPMWEARFWLRAALNG